MNVFNLLPTVTQTVTATVTATPTATATRTPNSYGLDLDKTGPKELIMLCITIIVLNYLLLTEFLELGPINRNTQETLLAQVKENEKIKEATKGSDETKDPDETESDTEKENKRTDSPAEFDDYPSLLVREVLTAEEFEERLQAKRDQVSNLRDKTLASLLMLEQQ